ncbi:MAG: sigma 54-interacting transcriptional regulator [Desulfobacterales bacterium]|nr:sigma 54-interacting transcriptional regulator [Desulfobacterales bacterium]
MRFFHQATRLICGSLDIDTVVERCFGYLKDFFPINTLMMSLYKPESGTVNVIAMVTNGQVRRHEAPIVLSRASRREIDMIHKQIPDTDARQSGAMSPMSSFGGRVVIHEDSRNHINAREVTSALGFGAVSDMVLYLKMEGEILGVVGGIADGRHRITPAHARRFALLHDPFAIAMSNALKHREVLRLKELLTDDNRYLREELHRISGEDIIGENFGLRDVMEMVGQVAPLDSHVLLLGETGVGKEVIANAIHYASPRRNGPLIKVNCGAIPEMLLDSELFGHEKGAFTGAVALKRGRFERANAGTLFLDEIGELPQAAQVRLLRVIQFREVERVGGIGTVPVDVRIIAATHRNLAEWVKKGDFREDLWFRLNVFPITIPPLRHRKADIPALLHHFIERKAREMKLRYLPVPAPGVAERLQQYNWPGNVRELENAVERELIRHQARGAGHPLAFKDVPGNPAATPSLPPTPVTGNSLLLADMERTHIQRILEMVNGKIQGADGAAARLGLHPSTLRNRMRRLGVAFGREVMN